MDLEKCVLNFKNIFGTDEKEYLTLFSDVTLKTEEGCTFEVHRVILARNNDYFYALFSSLDGRDRKEFFIPGVSGETLSNVLIYLYTGRITLAKQNVADVMVGADYLLVDAVYKIIHQGIHNLIHLDNCVDLLAHADQINNADVFNVALKFIQAHFADVVNKHKTSLSELSMELLCGILCCKSLRTFGEKSVWLAIVGWVQKDLQNRMSCVPLLLTYLARNETDETLAEEIMGHGIVENNMYCRFLNYKQSGTSLSFLQNYLRTQREHSLDFRMPSRLYVAIKQVFENNTCHYNIYVTYDENLDLWRKITKVDHVCGYIIPMNNILCIFVFQYNWTCLKLDINENKFLQEQPLNQFRQISVAKLDKCVFVFNHFPINAQRVAVFNEKGNLFANDISHCNLRGAEIACVSGKIYALGRSMTDVSGIIFKVYNAESHTWSILDSPSDIVEEIMVFINFQEKLVIIGGAVEANVQPVEIYNPISSKWRRVQDVPFSCDAPGAVVWMKELFVYDSKKIGSTFHVWNDPQELWEAIDGSHPLKNILKQSFNHRVLEIDDVETIKILSKGNQYQNAKLERFDLNDSD